MTYYAFDVGMVTLGIALHPFLRPHDAARRRPPADGRGSRQRAGAGGSGDDHGDDHRRESGPATSAGNIAPGLHVGVVHPRRRRARSSVPTSSAVARGATCTSSASPSRFGIMGGYLFLQPALPDQGDRLHADRRRALPADLRVHAAGRRSARSCPALDNPPLLTIHVAMAMISYGIFAVSFGAAVGYLIQGRENRVSLAAPAQGARRGRLPGGHHRLPDLRHADHPGLLLGLDRLGPLLGLGSQGDVGARDVAHLRGLPARAQPARLGRPAGGAHPGHRLRRGACFTYLGGNLFFGGLHSLQRACSKQANRWQHGESASSPAAATSPA